MNFISVLLNEISLIKQGLLESYAKHGVSEKEVTIKIMKGQDVPVDLLLGRHKIDLLSKLTASIETTNRPNTDWSQEDYLSYAYRTGLSSQLPDKEFDDILLTEWGRTKAEEKWTIEEREENIRRIKRGIVVLSIALYKHESTTKQATRTPETPDSNPPEAA